MRICHLLGNGPSKAAFLEWKKNKSPEDIGDIYGCNFGEPGIDFKAVFIHDRRPFQHMLKKRKFLNEWPIIVRRNYIRLAQRCIKEGLIPKENFNALPPQIREKTSGHDGLIYLAYFAEEKYDEIHLWGFDSLVNGTVESDSKGKIEGSNPQQRLVPRWTSRFNFIFAQMKKKGRPKVVLHENEIFFTVMTDIDWPEDTGKKREAPIIHHRQKPQVKRVTKRAASTKRLVEKKVKNQRQLQNQQPSTTTVEKVVPDHNPGRTPPPPRTVLLRTNKVSNVRRRRVVARNAANPGRTQPGKFA